jgi:hypothetical protein
MLDSSAIGSPIKIEGKPENLILTVKKGLSKDKEVQMFVDANFLKDGGYWLETAYHSCLTK